MDKYVKQCQKSNLWARRRNNTATHMLQGQLKYLERDYFRDYRQYLRDKIRIQAELRELKDKPSEDDEESKFHDDRLGVGSRVLVTANLNDSKQGSYSIRNENGSLAKTPKSTTTESKNPPQHKISSPRKAFHPANGKVIISEPRSGKAKRSVNQGSINMKNKTLNSKTPKAHDPVHSDKDSGGPDLSPRRAYSSLSTLSSIQNASSEIHCSDVSSGDRHNTTTDDLSSTPRNVVSSRKELLFNIRDFQPRSRSVSSSHSLCRYSPDHTTRHLCHHFPCTTPVTYHTLGYRRNDLIPWTSDVYETGTPVSELDERVWESPLFVDRSRTAMDDLETSLNLSIETDDELRFKSSRACPSTPRWSKKGNHPPFQFRPINGPLFSPKPSDPILENVRMGSSKPLPAPHTGGRVTIKDKLRGLKQLVGEMRARNESTRPIARAINYGQKLPARVLLNPVVPVVL